MLLLKCKFSALIKGQHRIHGGQDANAYFTAKLPLICSILKPFYTDYVHFPRLRCNCPVDWQATSWPDVICSLITSRHKNQIEGLSQYQVLNWLLLNDNKILWKQIFLINFHILKAPEFYHLILKFKSWWDNLLP